MNMNKMRPALALIAGLLALPSFADDTDLYLDPNSAYGTEPIVIFNLDYGSNFTSTVCSTASTCPEAEYFRRDDAPQSVKDYMAALGSNKMKFNDLLLMTLREVFAVQNKVKVGLMMSHNDSSGECAGQQPSGSTCSNGGFILMDVAPMNDDPLTTGINEAVTTPEKFFGKLQDLPEAGGNLDHPFQGKETYFELYRYLTGGYVYNGQNDGEDFKGIPDAELTNSRSDPDALHPNSKRYASPITAQCSKIFVINIMFQVLGSDDDSDTAIQKPIAEGGMALTASKNKITFEDLLKFLSTQDLSGTVNGQQTVTSYFVTKNDNTTTRGYATAGGTTAPYTFNESDPEALVASLQRIFNEILSVSTTFVSASVPVNVFNRSESLDNVFIALFQAETTPFWTGNLKKLKIKTETVNGTFSAYLVDANDEAAVAADGRIRYEALTHWTVSGSLDDPAPNSLEIAGKDGRVVDRGGAGQKVPGFLAGGPGLANGPGYRQLFFDPVTVINGSANSLQPFDVATASIDPGVQTALGAADATEAATYLKYARGLKDDGTTRDWLIGDPLHSRPLPINYGSLATDPARDAEDPDVYIAMAAQDGFMHFFRNSDGTGTNTDTADGEEVWGFMPREVMGGLKTYHTNSGEKAHPYMVDGAPSVFLDDVNQDGNIRHTDGDAAYLYFGLRRGGKAYYALDISDPLNPSLKWRITKSGDFTEMGQSWSTPRVGKIDPDGDGGDDPIPIAVFGGGYDTNKDTRSVVGTADTEGNAIYVVNAETGALIWKAIKGTGSNSSTIGYHEDMTDSIPSDVTLVDTDGNGYSDRILVGDTGGKVWRMDIDGPTTNWNISLLASVGSDADRLNDRRFFHAPDIVQSKDSTGNFDAVIIGSGDRPNPLDRPNGSVRVENWMFMIKDRRTAPHDGSTVSTSVEDLDRVATDFKDITDACMTTACTPAELSYGWRLKLTEGPGEKSLSSPLTIDNVVYFTTYLPLGRTVDLSDDVEKKTCGPAEGRGLLYAVSLADGTPPLNYNEYNDDGETEVLDSTDRFRELSSHGIPADVVSVSRDGRTLLVDPGLNLEEAGSSNRWRTFWYNVEDSN